MFETHCHACGGFLTSRRRLSYRVPSPDTPRAIPQGGACTCSVSILDGPPPGYASVPAMASVMVPSNPLRSTRRPFRKSFRM